MKKATLEMQKTQLKLTIDKTEVYTLKLKDLNQLGFIQFEKWSKIVTSLYWLADNYKIDAGRNESANNVLFFAYRLKSCFANYSLFCNFVEGLHYNNADKLTIKIR